MPRPLKPRPLVKPWVSGRPLAEVPLTEYMARLWDLRIFTRPELAQRFGVGLDDLKILLPNGSRPPARAARPRKGGLR